MRTWFPLLAGCLLLIASCQQPEPEAWTDLIPDKTPFLILPEEGESILTTLQAPYAPLFDETSPASRDRTREIFETVDQDLQVHALLLYPSTSYEWKPVWLAASREGVTHRLTQSFQREFAQNNYRFKGHQIEILILDDRSFYLTETGSYTIFSESSLAIEDMIRTLAGELPLLSLREDQLLPGSVIINTPNLERWVEQMADIGYRSLLQGAFAGTEPVAVRLNTATNGGTLLWSLEGELRLNEQRSPLIHSISSDAGSFLLDQYIPSPASAFSILRQQPTPAAPEGAEANTDLDRYLQENPTIYSNISEALDPEFAFVAFAESGFMSSSEFLFLRRLNDPTQLQSQLNNLVNENLAEELGSNVYYVNSSWLGRLIGSDISPLAGFYIAIHDQAAALSRSNSLVISVGNEYERRRVVYYDDPYQQLRSSHQESLSSFTYVDAPSFNSYVQPWLFPQNYMPGLTSNLEILAFSTAKTSSGSLHLQISSHDRDETREPFIERWTYPLSSDLAAAPALGNITGDNRDEIVISTTDGTMVILRADGSPVAQATMSPDRPVGSPVLNDWYGNNQMMILQAAGNSIYAWNEAGSPLPNFPITLDEEITSPLQVIDVTRNGVAEMVVTTADRQLHILNARGNPVSGWPETTNSVIDTRPVVGELNGERSIFAFAENSVHAWGTNGVRRSGFPVFIDSRFTGFPVLHNSFLLGSAADGNLYAIGESSLFDPDLAATEEGDSLVVTSIDIGNSPLTHAPIIQEEQVRIDDETVREELILTQGRNGSIHLYNLDGELRFTQSMGQPASETTAPQFLDLKRNGRTDVVAFASSGRLYAWDIMTGSSLGNLPTTAMNMPIITDLNSDGNLEIIAQTGDGIRVWTIYR